MVIIMSGRSARATVAPEAWRACSITSSVAVLPTASCAASALHSCMAGGGAVVTDGVGVDATGVAAAGVVASSLGADEQAARARLAQHASAKGRARWFTADSCLRGMASQPTPGLLNRQATHARPCRMAGVGHGANPHDGV